MKVKNIKKNFKQKEERKEKEKDYVNSSSDSNDSDNEDIKNRRGVIPREWYQEMDIQGYDLDAKKILKQKQSNKLEDLIKKTEDENWWKTIRDELNDKDIVLSDEQLDLLDRIRNRRYANSQKDEEIFVEFDWDEGLFPLSSAPQSKKKFMASEYERKLVNKLVMGIKQGKIKLKKDKEEKEEELFDIWEQSDNNIKNGLERIVAPKLKLPGHQESYNPSEEYLFDEEERKQWEEKDPDERTIDFIPKKYSSLRRVEGYQNLVLERFERCMDLYLQPRLRKKKLDIDPDSLIPNMPKPDQLRPFPTQINLNYEGHQSRVRSISVNNTGQYLASCDEQGIVIVWDVITARVLKQFQLEGINYQVQWSNHVIGGGLLAVANDQQILLYNLDILMFHQQIFNQTLLDQSYNAHQKAASIDQHGINWKFNQDSKQELRLSIKLDFAIKQIDWHCKGDYLLSVCPSSSKKNEVIWVHSLSKGQSQRPFSKSKSNLEKAVFHPSKPLLILMCRKSVYIYNLAKNQMIKKLLGGAQWNSSIHVHPKGDNILVGSFDRKVMWFDLDLANTPYKTMKYHNKAVRSVKFHPRYPLFASCSDDCQINIFHGNVYNDLMQNALIVPLKMLRGHKYTQEIGVLDIEFHPKQPWIFSCGADHNIILWT